MTRSDCCEVCQYPGLLFECSRCGRAYHDICLNESPNTDPNHKWKCPQCVTPSTRVINNKFFSDIPVPPQVKVFELPDYVYKMTRIDKWSIKEQPSSAKTPADQIVTCFVCCTSGDHLKHQMVQCCSCNDWYHMDCVSPPLVSIPTNWQCPKHLEQLMASRQYTEHVEAPPINHDMVKVIELPQTEELKSFGVSKTKYLPGESIRNKFLAKARIERNGTTAMTSEQMALEYLSSVEAFVANAIKTVQERFHLKDGQCLSANKKLEELHAIIEVL